VAQPMWRRLLPFAAVAAAASVVVGLAGWSVWPAGEPRTVTRLDYVLPEGQALNFVAGTNQLLAVSPDGRHFVYSTLAGLYLRAMGELDARLIPGTAFALGTPNFSPVFSPDGESIAYFVRGEVRRIAIGGGAPVVIARDGDGGSLSSRPGWGELGNGQHDSLQCRVRHLARIGRRRHTGTCHPERQGRVDGQPETAARWRLGALQPDDGDRNDEVGPCADCRAVAPHGRAHGSDARGQRRALCAVGAPGVCRGERSVCGGVRSGPTEG